MKRKHATIVVSADPRKSGRAAEAVRIAAGVGGWEKVEVKLCLVDEARRVLTEAVDELVNGEVFENYLPLLVAGEPRLYVVEAQPRPEAPRDGRYAQVPTIGLEDLAQMCREGDMVLRF